MNNPQPKLLIVDDNPKNLQVLGKTLEQLNYHVEFSINAESALEWIENVVFDLILLDIMMPGMNGLEVCKLIRTNKNYDDVPIIFLSAETDKNTILEGFELGAQDYITKPFDSRELLARVKTHLELKYSREQLKMTNQILELKVAERTSELKKSNEELSKANEELLGLDKVKTEFLNIISHEIRTPLNGILGPIELIKHELNDSKLTKLFEILNYSVSRLEKFALTALTITELKSGVRCVSLEKINLNELIQKALITINEISKPKNLRFDIGTISNELIIKGDLRELIMCFKGILENAVIYSPPGGNIFIRAESKNNGISCEISDEGPGFSEIALKNLFKLFRPGEPHIDQNIGLDLTLAKLIMEAHSGKIIIENLAVKGAMVKLIFPLDDE